MGPRLGGDGSAMSGGRADTSMEVVRCSLGSWGSTGVSRQFG